MNKNTIQKNVRDLMTAHERWGRWCFFGSVNEEANDRYGLLQGALFHAINPGNEDEIPNCSCYQTELEAAEKAYDVAASILLSELNS
jgi:hypothetical protein